MTKPRTQSSFVLFSRPTTLTVMPPDIQGRHESRVEDYLKKSVILKQIMSNKARRYRKINAAQNIATVVVSALLLFFGFSGLPKVQTWISWVHPMGPDATELGFNLLVFLLFVIGVLHLVFHFAEKQAAADKAVASLAALANEIEDMITSRGNLVISEDASKIALIRTRYESIAESIPANSDREFIRAKRDLARKEARKPRIHLDAELLFDKGEQQRIVSAIALGSRTVVDVLLALRKTGPSLYLGGGLIRNAVWDHLHGYRSPTAVDDVDVIHFDETDTRKRRDDELNAVLATEIPNIRWSTKNQARMHSINGEEPYTSLDDAIQRWPETATAMVVRLNDDGTLEFRAPFGFDDLLRLVVTNTPAFASRQDIIRDRVTKKRWLETWPRLRLWLSTEPLPPSRDDSTNPRRNKKGFVQRILRSR